MNKVFFTFAHRNSFVFTNPILKIRKALSGIAARDFSYVLDIKNNDELGDLGKLVNDNFGHLTGDRILEEIAEILRNHSRSLDAIGRWGGEEFILVLSNTKLEDAVNMAEQYRAMIESHDFGEVKTLTASFGVGEYHSNMPLNAFIKNIDDALYRAKEKGRNCVETAFTR